MYQILNLDFSPLFINKTKKKKLYCYFIFINRILNTQTR